MSRTIFKVPLELIPIDDSGTPQFLSIVCDFIKDQSKCEGIFRKSGHEKMIIKINEKLAQHVPEMPKDATVHDAANFLKRWLMLLPTPLFDPKIINVHCKENSPQSFISAISKLPQINQICLMHIFDVLRTIVKYQKYNLMNIDNIAKCFTVSLTQNMKELKQPFYFNSLYKHYEACLKKDVDTNNNEWEETLKQHFNQNSPSSENFYQSTNIRITKIQRVKHRIHFPK